MNAISVNGSPEKMWLMELFPEDCRKAYELVTGQVGTAS